MQKKLFKQFPPLEAFSKKIASILLLGFLLSNVNLFGKNNNSAEKETNASQAQIFISEDAIVYNISGFENAKIVIQKQAKQGEIFVSHGTLIYGVEDLGNVKIIKSKSITKSHSSKKQILLKEKLVVKKISTKTTTPKSSFFYNNSLPSTEFFYKKTRKTVFSYNKSQSFSKAFSSSEISFVKKVYSKRQQKINYINPSITVCYFSGKHSVRPPTLLS